MKSLFKDFKKSSKKDWLAKVEKDLKGKPIENLNWKIQEDLVVTPFAHSEDLKELPKPILENRKSNDWEKGVRIVVNEVKTANQEAIFLLEKGANALCFELVKKPNKKELKTLLEGIELEWISTHFILHQKSWKGIIQNFISIVEDKKQQLKKINCSFQFSDATQVPPADFAALQIIANQLPIANLITINARGLYQGQENVVNELVQTISKGNAYLEKWNEKELDLKNLISTIQFSIQIDDSYFLNIAKIRALKILWNLVVKSWKGSLKSNIAIETHLTTSTHTDDENYNKVKATTQAMSAVIGGTNRLYIYPSEHLKSNKKTLNDQRISLNIQHLMQLESYMDKVQDPAAGSYYLEQLTDDLAEAAWERFVNI
ncbi:MAG: methylmalonyl-CoA mutase family protein [Saprospiraceae bacterium]